VGLRDGIAACQYAFAPSPEVRTVFQSLREFGSVAQEPVNSSSDGIIARLCSVLFDGVHATEPVYNVPFMGMAIVDPKDGHWLYANDRLCEMPGYGREELLPTATWNPLTHPDDLASDQTQYWRLLNGEIDSYEIEKRLLHKAAAPSTISCASAVRLDSVDMLGDKLSAIGDTDCERHRRFVPRDLPVSGVRATLRAAPVCGCLFSGPGC
jgi:PAS domain-containing protein